MVNEEEKGLTFSPQSISSLMGATLACLTKTGDVDVGKVIGIHVSRESIVKVKIQSDKTHEVLMENAHTDAKVAYKIAIERKEKKIQDLQSDISAMQGRVKNIVDDELGLTDSK